MADAPTLPDPLPLEFQRPPRWPTPTLDWVAGNQGWEPPAGWTPVPECSPAPPGWVFWTRSEEGWARFAEENLAPAKRSLWIGVGVFVGGLLLTVLGLAVSHNALFLVFVAAIVAGPILTIRAGSRLKEIDDGLMDRVRALAPQYKHTLQRLAYNKYLRSFGPLS